MLQVINMHQAKTHFSQLVQQTLNGNDVVIGKAGTPLVRLVPYSIPQQPRVPGQWKGKVKIAKDFDKLPAAFLKAFKAA